MTLVVDASVAVKLFIEEPQSEIAARLLERDELLVAPAHFLGEVGQVIAQRRRLRQITLQQVSVARNVLPNLALLEPLPGIFDAALAVALEAMVSFYDALYVATAERWDRVVATADDKMIGQLRPSRWSGRVIALAEWGARKKGKRQ